MKNAISICLLLAFAIALPASLSAQDTPKPEKYTGDWYQIVHVKYKPGHVGKAKDIIENYFMKAGKAAGTNTPVMQAALISGEFDAMYVWKLKDGLADMEWEVSPDNLKWYKAMIEICGSEEAAKEKREEYAETVAYSSTSIARNMFK